MPTDTTTIVIYAKYPPIPSREFDFSAYSDDDEPDDNGHMTVGYGRTPLAAFFDYLAQVDGEQ